MLQFGNVFHNLLVVAVLGGLGYIIYLKFRGEKPEVFKNLLSKGKDIKEDTGFGEKGGKYW